MTLILHIQYEMCWSFMSLCSSIYVIPCILSKSVEAVTEYFCFKCSAARGIKGHGYSMLILAPAKISPDFLNLLMILWTVEGTIPCHCTLRNRLNIEYLIFVMYPIEPMG